MTLNIFFHDLSLLGCLSCAVHKIVRRRPQIPAFSLPLYSEAVQVLEKLPLQTANEVILEVTRPNCT